MILKVRTSADIPYSEVTPEELYRSRREFIRRAATGALGLAAGSVLASCGTTGPTPAPSVDRAGLASTRDTALSVPDAANSEEEITNYNNYYEFGTDKSDPAHYAGRLVVKPWTVKVDGLVDKPGDYAVDDLVDFNHLQERISRHRCVETWSMVMPWIGVPLADVLKKAQPQPRASFVEFTTVLRPKEMPGLGQSGLDWPYVEGLRIDEAMHPLAFMVVGLYGKVLPNQSGAPLRIHIPWKYGFKSGKSIVRIRFTDTQPKTTWNEANPPAYGFYGNVNPNVARPGDQSRERRLPNLTRNRPTLIFNGYADQVGGLYAGMDLEKNY